MGFLTPIHRRPILTGSVDYEKLAIIADYTDCYKDWERESAIQMAKDEPTRVDMGEWQVEARVAQLDEEEEDEA